MKVFVSHSFEDSEKFDECSAILRQHEIPFFKPSDMDGTRTLAEQLKKAIDDCDVCIFLATHNSVKSSWCGAELGAFWGVGKAVIIYLADSSLEDSQLPKQFQGLLRERNMVRVAGTVKNLFTKGSLAHLLEEIPRTRQVHGYSGKWTVKSDFRRWRNKDLGKSESVVFNGEASLFVQADGKRGSGMQKGTLHVNLQGYSQILRICNQVLEAYLSEEGKFNIKLKVFHRGIIQPPTGTPPGDLGEDWLHNVDAAPPFLVILEEHCPGEPKCLKGYHWFEPGMEPLQKADEFWTYSDV
jgi:hypothetical protein